MRKFSHIVLLFGLSSFFCLGCGRKEGTLSNEMENVKASVVVEVVGERLTVEDIEHFADIRIRMMANTLFQSKRDLANIREQLGRMRFSAFPGARLLVREAKRRGLQYSTVEYEHQCKRLSRLPEHFRETVAFLVDEDLSIGALRKDILAKTPAPDDDFLADRLRVITLRNARAQKTNECSRAFLTSLKKEILDGKIKFEVAARLHSEDDWLAESGPEWGTFKLADLAEDVEIYDALRQMREGDVAGPLFGDNGLMLLRVDKISDDGYSLSRIFRRLMAKFETETMDQMRTRFQNEDCEAHLEALVKRLLAENPPVYPNGTNFLDRIFEQSKARDKK